MSKATLSIQVFATTLHLWESFLISFHLGFFMCNSIFKALNRI